MIIREYHMDIRYSFMPTEEIKRNLKKKYGDRFRGAYVAYKLEDWQGIHKGKWLVWRLAVGEM